MMVKRCCVTAGRLAERLTGTDSEQEHVPYVPLAKTQLWCKSVSLI